MSSELVRHLTTDTFADTIGSGGVVLVDFWAPWCSPCRMLGPVIDELAGDYEGKAIICKVNVDEQQELAAQNGVKGVPSIFIYKNGEQVDSHVGAAPKSLFQEKLDKLL
ncbi:thioredoxin [Helicobacter monodelphidis]|uniref:thioredoxin n=1 Tax=Helicobacter sp. 15-1451 TaxID=2004995 RepID=UPI000DCCE560|nr:thioredoxin [Helicobacter sp. 15-1451]RAX57784.1 thioredoxin [Helicobacter sp. 15-1451]